MSTTVCGPGSDVGPLFRTVNVHVPLVPTVKGPWCDLSIARSTSGGTVTGSVARLSWVLDSGVDVDPTTTFSAFG